MKKSDKGFMLAETLVVASFISVTLLFLFVQFRTMMNNFDNSAKYNTVNALYLTNQIKEYLKDNNFQAMTIDLENSNEGYIDISSCTSKYLENGFYCQELMRKLNVNKVIYVSSKKPSVGIDFSKDFIEFIERNINKEENIYYLFSEFKDGTYGFLKMNGLKVPNIIDKIKQQSIYTFDNDSSDGLYFDKYSDLDVKYVFRGTNPNNYISFNNQLWRILSVEPQGIKIVGNSMMLTSWNYDNNIFTKSNLLNTGVYEYTSYKNSSSYERLNKDTDLDETTDTDGGYYGKISKEYQKFIAKDVVWYNGTVSFFEDKSLGEIVSEESERSYLANLDDGYVGLMQLSDYIKSSTNSNCEVTPFKNSNCATQNWLTNSLVDTVWTVNASFEENQVYTIQTNGNIISKNVAENAHLVPVLYLKPTLRLMGDGTINNPYIIIDEK